MRALRQIRSQKPVPLCITGLSLRGRAGGKRWCLPRGDFSPRNSVACAGRATPRSRDSRRDSDRIIAFINRPGRLCRRACLCHRGLPSAREFRCEAVVPLRSCSRCEHPCFCRVIESVCGLRWRRGRQHSTHLDSPPVVDSGPVSAQPSQERTEEHPGPATVGNRSCL